MSTSIDPVADGRRLAIAMLREFRDVSLEDCSCEEHFRPGRKQRDVLGKYLDLLGASRGDMHVGFCIVMNDFLAAASDGQVDVECYEALEAEGYDRNAEYFSSDAPSRA